MRRASFSDNPVLREQLPAWRSRLVLMMLMAAFLTLAGRALYVQVFSTEFLQQQGERRYERTLTLSATRGKILDRNNVVLASSVPARAIWAIPDDAKPATPEQLAKLAKLLGLSATDLRSRLDVDRNFVYLKRQVSIELANQIKKLDVPGIYQQAETRRFYPDGGVTAHLVGFTSVEDKGQEGVELTFDSLLSGTAGSRRVIKDRLGRVIEDVQAMTAPVNGRDLNLSIDARLQYLVYRELSEAVERHQAQAASAIIMDVKTGEILALASLPTYDPNDRETYHAPNLRNRTITDTFEPGSIMKPFTVALALDLQRISTKTQFDTGNGSFRYQGATIHDVSRHNGSLNAAGVLRRSSNIGMTLISEKLQSREMWERFTELGFGRAPQLGFPGAAPGRLRPWDRWRLIEKATMSYGYGLSVSLLQMARAYSVFARDGDMVAPTLVKRDSEPTSVKVYSPEVAVMVRGMLEDAAGPEGAKAAQVQGYRVAGKSGTARKIIDGKYSKRYRSSFVGFAPVSNPRIIVAVSIDDPTAGGYYGGAVAAPIFSSITGGSLRLMGVQPDAPFESTIVAGVREGAR